MSRMINPVKRSSSRPLIRRAAMLGIESTSPTRPIEFCCSRHSVTRSRIGSSEKISGARSEFELTRLRRKDNQLNGVVYGKTEYIFGFNAGIHLEKDMSVPFGHTVARTVCLFEILFAPKSVECAFFEIVRAPNQWNEI